MQGKIVLNLNNAMFSIGAARIKLRALGDDDVDAKLADITNQLRTIADGIWDGGNAYEQATAYGEQGAECDRVSGEPILMASQKSDMITKMGDTIKLGGLSRQAMNIPSQPSDAAFQKVDKLFFLDEWNGIKSIEPATIIGMTTLITFNVNTRQLAKYEAARDDNSNVIPLDVKGSTLKNFDPDTSKSYSKTIRHPEDVIPHINNGTPEAATYKLHKTKAIPKSLTGRINKHTLLLKAW